MPMKPSAINVFLMFKLPAAYFTGVRVKSISEESCTTSVRHRWINQNPFKSMFWAVQGMAAELSTGALVMSVIKDSGKPISMLVANNKASFSKKATGRITFSCNDGLKIRDAMERAIETGEGQTCRMHSTGRNKEGIIVSEFDFEWTVKLKNS
ncbi:MAG: DUF4442 domain-containing protein [Bacteroidia bacterium]|nr:DUF4442 domain-containing protein [Bacteroidia bacterium]NNF30861.1 DUF4442 domain-containing protein [Flavobacteriaceae bacterium]MBT8275432.1 DUF4442 domain-containing protein [Bacteroidia bacterium]NNJ81944.1 DUF4442 domain-containing protein [Flavobacteriaceae bacterium]NNK54474.1 DUF4442 domain-containing protein [Flavobacteriaceae bacterium]